MNAMIRLFSGCALVLGLAACSSAPEIKTPDAAQAYTGKVFITEDPVPEGMAHVVIGEVTANTKDTRFSSSKTVYELLADDARRVGANAVVNVEGGRRVDATGWTAGFAAGQAIRIDSTEGLKALPGAEY
ncbi:MAG: hypothetical protein AB8C46_06090 [Burkholderiaceae bacterium]